MKRSAKKRIQRGKKIMSKTITTKSISIGLIVAVALIAGFYLGASILRTFGANPIANNAGEKTDIVGTNVGTTTTGVSFYARVASTTYPVKLGADKKNVTLFLKSLATSTSEGSVSFSILGSNDRECYTASTSAGTLNSVLTSDINWYDIGDKVVNATGLTSLNSATTTFTWMTNGTAKGKTLTLDNVNAKCLALEVAASSTVLHVEVMTRDK